MALSKILSAILAALTLTSTRRDGCSPGPSMSLRMFGFSNDRSLMYWATTRTCSGGPAAPAGGLPTLLLPVSVGSAMDRFLVLVSVLGLCTVQQPACVDSYPIAVLAAMRPGCLLVQAFELALDDGPLALATMGTGCSWCAPDPGIGPGIGRQRPLHQALHAPTRNPMPDRRDQQQECKHVAQETGRDQQCPGQQQEQPIQRRCHRRPALRQRLLRPAHHRPALARQNHGAENAGCHH